MLERNFEGFVVSPSLEKQVQDEAGSFKDSLLKNKSNGEEAGRAEVEDILADDLACAYVFGSTPFNDFDNYDVGTLDMVLIAKEENLAITSMADGLDGPLEGSYVALSHEIDPTSIRKSSQKPSLCCKSRYKA